VTEILLMVMRVLQPFVGADYSCVGGV